MWLTKKILVATDFGEPSHAAADMGLQLAKNFQVPLMVFHAYQVPASTYMGVPALPVLDYAKMYEDSARQALEKEGARLAGHGAEVSTLLRSGVAWEEALSAAKQLDVGLIIVGTHGRRGLPRAILGSVAEKIVRLSEVPVLTMHANPEAQALSTKP